VETFTPYNEIIIFKEQLCTVCPIWIFILDTVQIYSMVQKLEHFPLSNFPDFPGRNAFVEVSGRGGGERILSNSSHTKFVPSGRGGSKKIFFMKTMSKLGALTVQRYPHKSY